jgi:hypothetical protein
MTKRIDSIFVLTLFCIVSASDLAGSQSNIHQFGKNFFRSTKNIQYYFSEYNKPTLKTMLIITSGVGMLLIVAKFFWKHNRPKKNTPQEEELQQRMENKKSYEASKATHEKKEKQEIAQSKPKNPNNGPLIPSGGVKYEGDDKKFKVGDWVKLSDFNAKIDKNIDYGNYIVQIENILPNEVTVRSYKTLSSTYSKQMPFPKKQFTAQSQKVTQEEVRTHIENVMKKVIPSITNTITQDKSLMPMVELEFANLAKLFNDPCCKDAQDKSLLSEQTQKDFSALKELINLNIWEENLRKINEDSAKRLRLNKK